MSRAVLSDDESDHENGTHLGQGRYSIVKEEWHSDELIIWLRIMDLLACSEKWAGWNVARQGNTRRLRVHSLRSKDGVAVSGLPENCYSTVWLNSLQPHERYQLDIQPPLNMQFSEVEQQYVLSISSTSDLIFNHFTGWLHNISHLQTAILSPLSQGRTPTSVASMSGSCICSEKWESVISHILNTVYIVVVQNTMTQGTKK